MLTKAPRGTKDIMPDQIYKWHFIESKFAAICRKYGFEEIRTPIFEHTELFQRGVGDTTDIVQKEMYTFEDNGHRSITLKPEGTSPTVRAFSRTSSMQNRSLLNITMKLSVSDTKSHNQVDLESFISLESKFSEARACLPMLK